MPAPCTQHPSVLFLYIQRKPPEPRWQLGWHQGQRDRCGGAHRCREQGPPGSSALLVSPQRWLKCRVSAPCSRLQCTARRGGPQGRDPQEFPLGDSVWLQCQDGAGGVILTSCLDPSQNFLPRSLLGAGLGPGLSPGVPKCRLSSLGTGGCCRWGCGMSARGCPAPRSGGWHVVMALGQMWSRGLRTNRHMGPVWS